jgi:hypothetical protein
MLNIFNNTQNPYSFMTLLNRSKTKATDSSAMTMFKIHTSVNAGLIIILLSVGGINLAEAKNDHSLFKNSVMATGHNTLVQDK